MTHGKLVAAIAQFANSMPGCYAWANRCGAVRHHGRLTRFGQPGTTDVIAMMPRGRTAWIEAKVGKDTLSAEQISFRDRCQTMGHAWLCVRGIDVFAVWFAEVSR